MAILGGSPIGSLPISGQAVAAAATNDDIVQAVFIDDGLYVDSEAEASTDYFQGVQGSPLQDAPAAVGDISKAYFDDPVWIIDEDEWTPDWAQAPPSAATDDLVDCDYPILRGQTSGVVVPAQATSFTVTFPATVKPGDILVVFTSNQSGANTTADGAGWTASTATDLTFQCLAGFWRRYAAGDGASAGFTCSVSSETSWWCGDYDGCHPTSSPVFSTPSEGTATTADPLSFTTTWGSDKAKFLSFLAISGVRSATGVPSGYTTISDLATGTADVDLDHRAIVTTKNDAAGFEDPSVFTLDASGDFSTIGLAIRGSCGTKYPAPVLDTPDDDDEPLTAGVFGSPLENSVVADASITGVSNELFVDEDEPLTEATYGYPPDSVEDIVDRQLPDDIGPEPDDADHDFQGVQARGTSFPDDETGETTGQRSLPDGSELPQDEDDYDYQGVQAEPSEDAVVADASILGSSLVDPLDDDELVTDGQAQSPIEDTLVAESSILGTSTVVPDDDDEYTDTGFELRALDLAAPVDDKFLGTSTVVPDDDDEPVTDGLYQSPLEDSPIIESTHIVDTVTVVPDTEEEYIDYSVFGAERTEPPPTVVSVTGISINVLLGCYHVYGFAAIPDGSGSWAAVSPASNSWSMVSDGSTSWTPSSGATGSWVMMPDGSTVWTDEC